MHYLIEDFFEIPVAIKDNVVSTIVFGVPWPEKANKEEGSRKKNLKVPHFRLQEPTVEDEHLNHLTEV